MSDFFQHGLISTLYQLNEQPRPLELSAGRGKLGLILPCQYRDLASAALTSIIEVLNSSGLFDLMIVAMNGIGETQAPGGPPICYLLFAICYLSSQHSSAAIYALVYENEWRRE